MSTYPSIQTASVDTTRIGQTGGVQRVVVTDVQMPFGSMVTFIVKWTIAAIPALIILFIIFMVLGGMFAGFLTSMMRS
jgi:hypothetical protein